MNFPQHIIKKFSVQDATLAKCNLAVRIGLTSVWIGMIDEQKAMQRLSQILSQGVSCALATRKRCYIKAQGKLTDLIHEI